MSTSMSDPRIYASVTRISDLRETPFKVEEWPRERWGTGDYVVAELLGRPRTALVELTNGRMVEPAEGDLVVGALGERFATLEATGTWREVEEDGRMHLLTSGGLLGRCTSLSTLVPDLPEVRYSGHVVRAGSKTRMADFRVTDVDERLYDVPTVMIIGTSMSAGKTTTARTLIRRLRAMGLEVMGAKLTGAGRYRDILAMADAGAEPVYDFVDGGLPSTVCPEGEFREAMEPLLATMARSRSDVAVVEIGASPLEPYNGAVGVELLGDAVRMTVVCASDPYAVLGLTHAFGRTPDLVTGPAANTRGGEALVGKLLDVPCLNAVRRRSGPELDRLLRVHLDLGVLPG